MALYIVQHGLSLPKEIDPERGLSEEGRREVEEISRRAAHYGLPVSLIIHSGKKRAVQTAEILGQALRPAYGVRKGSHMDPNDDAASFARKLDAGDRTMLVGHLPFLEKLIAYLVTGNADMTVFKLQHGGIVCIDNREGAWMITWALMPHIG